jgi:hypothetical protein
LHFHARPARLARHSRKARSKQGGSCSKPSLRTCADEQSSRRLPQPAIARKSPRRRGPWTVRRTSRPNSSSVRAPRFTSKRSRRKSMKRRQDNSLDDARPSSANKNAWRRKRARSWRGGNERSVWKGNVRREGLRRSSRNGRTHPCSVTMARSHRAVSAAAPIADAVAIMAGLPDAREITRISEIPRSRPPSAPRSEPVLDREPLDARELPHVVRHEHRTVVKSDSGHQRVDRTDRRSKVFKTCMTSK